MRAEMVDGDGRLVPGSRGERTIERAVEVDLAPQLRDTRLFPGRSVTLECRRTIDARAARLRVVVLVEPVGSAPTMRIRTTLRARTLASTIVGLAVTIEGTIARAARSECESADVV